MAGIGANMILVVFSACIAPVTAKAVDTKCKTETNVSRYTDNKSRSQRSMWKTDAEHGGTKNPRTHTSGIKPTTTDALANVTVH